MIPLELSNESQCRTKPQTTASAKTSLQAKAARAIPAAMLAALLTGCTATATQSQGVEISAPAST